MCFILKKVIDRVHPFLQINWPWSMSYQEPILSKSSVSSSSSPVFIFFLLVHSFFCPFDSAISAVLSTSPLKFYFFVPQWSDVIIILLLFIPLSLCPSYVFFLLLAFKWIPQMDDNFIRNKTFLCISISILSSMSHSKILSWWLRAQVLEGSLDVLIFIYH